jgi:cell division protein FtsQ
VGVIRDALAVLALLCLGLAGWSVWRQLDQPVRSVRVQGALTPAEQQAIRQVVSESLRTGLLSMDVGELTDRIHDLSWPRAVRVRRVWPDALEIQVEKESVVAAWGDGGYLTSAGKVVELADSELAVPTLFASLSTPREAMEMYQLLQSRVGREGLSLVALEENELGEWLLTFESGMTLALGNEALGERLGRFLLAYRRALAARQAEIVHVDARYGNGVAVRWAEPERTPDAQAGEVAQMAARRGEIPRGLAEGEYGFGQ